MFHKQDINRDACQLFGGQAKQGYDWWWHNLTARHAETGEEKAFFFEYFVCNPKKGGQEPVLGQLPQNQANGVKPSYVMVKAGCWGRDARQLHRFFGWKQAYVSMKVPYLVEAEDCYASEKQIKGSIRITPEEAQAHPEWMCDSGELSWNLKVDKKIAFNVGYGASTLFRKIQAFEMFWHAEGMKTAYSGEIIWNGERYLVDPENCYGYADKNWGKDFTSPWVWLSSNDLISEKTGARLENSVFDIGGGCPKVGPVALPRKLLSAFYYEGQEFEFNFSKFWTFCRTKFHCDETDTDIVWHVEQRTWRNKMVVDITCPKQDMLLVNYEAPNGTKRHNRLWNGGTGTGTIKLYHNFRLVDTIHAGHIGCEYGEYDK